MKLNVETNFPDVAKQIDALADDIAKQASARAMNRTMEQGKTAMSRFIRDEFAMTAAKVNDALRINRVSASKGNFKLEASMESPSKRGRSLNLINFGARQTKKGVTFKVKRAGGRQIVTGAFIANQGRTVFVRTGKQRLPIKALQTINVAQMFNTRRINDKVLALITAKFPEIFEREARYYTERFNARRGG